MVELLRKGDRRAIAALVRRHTLGALLSTADIATK